MTEQHAPLAPRPTPVPGPLTLRVMSYNVLWGGGFDLRFEEFYVGSQRVEFGGRNRLPAIVDLIEGVAPDLVAVQEAAGWSEGDPSVADQIGAGLGMTYFMAHNPYELNTGLFSRFPLIRGLNLSPYLGTNSAQVAVLETPDGNALVVVNVHLDPFTSRMRSCQLDLILSVIEPLADFRAILIGDFNFRPGSPQFQQLIDEGWEPLVVEPTRRVDHIWTRAGETMEAEPLWPPGAALGVVDGRMLSDHYPIGVLVTFHERPAAESVSVELGGPRSVCVP